MEVRIMTYDPENKDTYFYVDDWNMVMVNEGTLSWRDSIGRTFDGYVAWGDLRFIDGVRECFIWKDGFRRHPDFPYCNDMSRDHISYALILFAYVKQGFDFFKLSRHLKWRISKKHTMRGLWLWIKGFYHPAWRFLFYVAKIFEMLGMLIWNRSLRIIARVKPERTQEEWDPETVHNRTKIQIWAGKKVFPAYALHNFAWQLHVLPDCFGKWLLKKIGLLMTGRTNYVVRHLFGDNPCNDIITYWDIMKYKSMTGGRWTTTLDELNDRWVEIREDSGVNDLDVDYLIGVINI